MARQFPGELMPLCSLLLVPYSVSVMVRLLSMYPIYREELLSVRTLRPLPRWVLREVRKITLYLLERCLPITTAIAPGFKERTLAAALLVAVRYMAILR